MCLIWIGKVTEFVKLGFFWGFKFNRCRYATRWFGKSHCLISSICFIHVDPSQPQFLAKATVSLGDPKLFSGEAVQLDCNVPDDHSSSWLYQWFHDGVPLSSNKVYSIKKARIQQSGSYTCRGRKQIKIWPYSIMSNPSDPLKIHVDGKYLLFFILTVV